MTLISGRWEDEAGVIYSIPSFTRDKGDERALIKTARAQAAEKGRRVVAVWACYEYEKRLR